MLSAVTATIRHSIAATNMYTVVRGTKIDEAAKSINAGTYLRNCNGCELDIARKIGAQRVLIGWIFKMSTLIGTLHIRIEDSETGRVVYRHAFDFRGDNERSWTRAAKFFVDDLRERGETPSQHH